MCHEKERQRLHTYLSISKYIFHGLVQNQLRGGLYLGNGVGTKRNSANRGVIKQWRKNLNFFFFEKKIDHFEGYRGNIVLGR